MVDRPLVAELARRLWATWAEVGASTWSGDAQALVVVDLEALLIGTAAVADARMRDAALGWASAHRHLLSRARAKQLLRDWPDPRGWSEFAGQLTLVTEYAWPGATRGASVVWSGDPPVGLPMSASTLTLRIRSAFGVSTRSEVVSMFLRRPDRAHATASELVSEGAYSKRNISNALVALEGAGLLKRFLRSNTDRYQLTNPHPLRDVFAPAEPEVYQFVSWLRAAWILAAGLDAIADAPGGVRSVEARQVLGRVAAQLSTRPDTLSVPPGVDAWEPLIAWAGDFIRKPSALV